MCIYCIDTSALIDGWKDYPLEHFGVWKNIEKLINDNKLISPYHVLAELEVGGDELYNWCKTNDFFCSPTTKTSEIIESMMKKYPTFKPKKTQKMDCADPYVIAIAIEKDCTVISHETMKNRNEVTYYIPDICYKYNINHISLLDLIKNKNWKFF